MAGQLFDVYVVGARDESPETQKKLATTLAGRLGLPIPGVAQALAAKRLPVGQGLDEPAAQALVRELQMIGAQVHVRPSSGAATMVGKRTIMGLPPPAGGAPPYGAGPPMPSAAPGSGPPPMTMAPSTSPYAPSSMGPPPKPPSGAFSPAPGSAAGFAVSPGSGFGSAPGSGSNPGGRDPFAPPPSRPNALSLDTGSGRPPAPPAPSDPFGARDEAGPGLELETRGRTSSDDMRREQSVAPGSSSRLEAGQSASLSVDREAQSEAYRVKCPKHGLYYDKRKASGCRKCLEPGRKMAAAITSANPWVRFKLYDFGENATARAFAGIGVALLVGLMPAAFHAMRVGVRDLHRLRGEQELLSHRPASEDIVRRFDELETDIAATNSRAMRNTAIIWFVVTGGAMAAWYKLT